MGSADHGRGTAPLLQQRVQGALDGEVLVLHGVGGVNHSTGLLKIEVKSAQRMQVNLARSCM